MARIVPKKELWNYTPDPRVMRAPPRRNGTTATDVLRWMQVLSAGADMVGPIAGAFFTGGKSGLAANESGNFSPEDLEATATAVSASGADQDALDQQIVNNLAADDAAPKGAPGVSEFAEPLDLHAGAQAPNMDERRALGAFDSMMQRPSSASLMSQATAAALSGDRARAIEVAKRMASANYGDVTASGFGDMLSGAHKDRRRAAIQKILLSGRYSNPVDPSLTGVRNSQIEKNLAQADESRGRLVRAEESRPKKLEKLGKEIEQLDSTIDHKKLAVRRSRKALEKFNAEFAEWTASAGTRKKRREAEAQLKDLNAQLKALDLKHFDARERRKIQKHKVDIRKKLSDLRLGWANHRQRERGMKQRDKHHKDNLGEKRKSRKSQSPEEKRRQAALGRHDRLTERVRGAEAYESSLPSAEIPSGTKMVTSGKDSNGNMVLHKAKPGERPTHVMTKRGVQKIASWKTRAERRKAKRKARSKSKALRAQAAQAYRHGQQVKESAKAAGVDLDDIWED